MGHEPKSSHAQVIFSALQCLSELELGQLTAAVGVLRLAQPSLPALDVGNRTGLQRTGRGKPGTFSTVAKKGPSQHQRFPLCHAELQAVGAGAARETIFLLFSHMVFVNAPRLEKGTV